jgi:hypothetical protein
VIHIPQKENDANKISQGTLGCLFFTFSSSTTSTMAERNLEHRTQSSRFNPGDFAVPWVGKNPLIVKRRQYRTAYLNWILPFLAQRQQVLEHERKIRKEAEQTVVARYIANGLFEYQVDRFYWESWRK